MNILIINGPNLNKLGVREPHIYGDKSLSDIEKYTTQKLSELGFSNFKLTWKQDNSESELIEMIHKADDHKYDALIINPAGYSHTSIALMDALLGLSMPKVEVHLSNTQRIEEFRKTKYSAGACDAVFEGAGFKAYLLATIYLLTD